MTFGLSPSLERIGDFCFGNSGLVELKTPHSVKHLGEHLFDPFTVTVYVSAGAPGNRTCRDLIQDISLSDTVLDLQAKIYDKLRFRPGSQTMMFRSAMEKRRRPPDRNERLRDVLPTSLGEKVFVIMR